MLEFFQIFEYLLFLNATKQLSFEKKEKSDNPIVKHSEMENTVTNTLRNLLPRQLALSIQECFEATTWLCLKIFQLPIHKIIPKANWLQQITHYQQNHPYLKVKSKTILETEPKHWSLFDTIGIDRPFILIYGKKILSGLESRTKVIVSKEIIAEYQQFKESRNFLFQQEHGEEENKLLFVPRYAKFRLLFANHTPTATYEQNQTTESFHKELTDFQTDFQKDLKNKKKQKSFVCASCYKPNSFLRCSRCKTTHYCSKTCQSTDYSFHSFVQCEKGVELKLPRDSPHSHSHTDSNNTFTSSHSPTQPQTKQKKQKEQPTHPYFGFLQSNNKNAKIISYEQKDDDNKPKWNGMQPKKQPEKQPYASRRLSSDFFKLEESQKQTYLCTQMECDDIYPSMVDSIRKTIQEGKENEHGVIQNLENLTQGMVNFFQKTLEKLVEQTKQVKRKMSCRTVKKEGVKSKIKIENFDLKLRTLEFNQKLAETYFTFVKRLRHEPSLNNFSDPLSALRSFEQKLALITMCEFHYDLNKRKLKIKRRKKKKKKSRKRDSEKIKKS